MNYSLKINEILDRCNLSEEEQNAFALFLDGKVFKDKLFYPDYEKDIKDMSKINPLLDSAQKKVHLCGQWANIRMLIQIVEWESSSKEK